VVTRPHFNRVKHRENTTQIETQKMPPNRDRSHIIRIAASPEEKALVDQLYERKVRGFQARMLRQLLAPHGSRNLGLDAKKAVHLAQLVAQQGTLAELLRAQNTLSDCDIAGILILLGAILHEAQEHAL
jgi:hypothetical protein